MDGIFTYGFYDSINGDRKYKAEELSTLFNGIINDGVFDNVGELMTVTAVGAMAVAIGSGRAWFDGTWTNISSKYRINFSDFGAAEPPAINSRIDVIALQINKTNSVRANSIVLVKGTIAGSPVAPELTNNDNVKQYPLAYVTVRAGVTEITQADIENKVGTSLCPFVTGILKTTNIDVLLKQWDAEFDDWMTEKKTEFMTWFNEFEDTLSDDAAASLLLRIKAVEAENELMRSTTDLTFKADSWGVTTPYMQSVPVTNLSADDRPIIQAMIPSNIASNKEEDYLEECGYVTRFECGYAVENGKMVAKANHITAVCPEDMPKQNLMFVLKGR